MRTIELIKTYRCKHTAGFVYLLDGRKCASLAKSWEALCARLGATEETVDIETLAEQVVAKLAAEDIQAEYDWASDWSAEAIEIIATQRLRRGLDRVAWILIKEDGTYHIHTNKRRGTVIKCVESVMAA